MFTIHRTVSGSHCDCEGFLTIGAAMDFMQDCSLFQIDSERELSAYFKENNCGMYVTSRQADFYRRPAYGERLTVSTWVYEVNALFGFRNTTITDEEGKICAASYAMGAFVDLDKARTVRIPKELIGSIVTEEKLDMEYLPRKIILPEVSPEEMPAITVPRAYIDRNRHMNNAKYITAAAEYLPEDFETTRLRVEYKTAARQGDTIYPNIYKQNGAVTVALNGSGTTYAIIEFIEKESVQYG